LLAKGCEVRAVVRDANKAGSWAKEGCEIAVADMYAAKSLETAFHEAEGVFVMLPAYFDPSPDFRESRTAISAFRSALFEADPPKIVCLSTIGAQSARPESLGATANPRTGTQHPSNARHVS
jgi:NAD(P)H dehydrogenase (quinone)